MKADGVDVGETEAPEPDQNQPEPEPDQDEDNDNRPPIVTSSIANVRLDIIENSLSDPIALESVFEDPDGDALTYTAISSDPSKVRVAIGSNNALTVGAVGGEGTATITVTASDGKGGSVNTSFTVTALSQISSDDLKKELIKELSKDISKELAKQIVYGRILPTPVNLALSVRDTAKAVKLLKQEFDLYRGNRSSSATGINNLAEALYIHHQALENGSLSLEQVFSGQSFSIPLTLSQASPQEQDTGAATAFNALLKASFHFSRFSDSTANLDWDGSATSYHLGIDLLPNPDVPLLAGLQLAFTNSHANFEDTEAGGGAEGNYKLQMFSVHPSIAWDATDNLTLWASLGYGRPNTETTIDSFRDPRLDSAADSSHSSSGDFFSVAGGANYRVWQFDASALSLNLSGSTASFLDNDFQEGRIAAQFSHNFPLNAGQLNSAADLAILLSDSNPSAAELSGQLNWLPNQSRLSGSTNARVLLFGGDRSEWGIGGSVTLLPGQQGKGLSLALQPSFGRTASRLDQLLDSTSFLDGDDLAFSTTQPTAQLRAEAAYGFLTGNNALLTPYTKASFSTHNNTYAAGLRYQLDSGLDLDLSASHRQRSSGKGDNRFFLQLRSDL